ncbi:MAG: tRNA (guanosine(37)-N1)-methyltransferase TrmD [Bacteroidetes bacterium]|nr:tRNA (guanosine(37)-N1)-methyltransferase TrmD [Bacteroidota bacterium]
MRIDVIAVVPKVLSGPLSESIIKRAQERELVEIVVHDLREYGLGKYHQIDDEPFGGGAGMVLRCEPIFTLVRKLQSERTYDEIVFLTPDGKTFVQDDANDLSLKQNIIMICGRYKGIDERIRQALVTREISIGDYVLTGGELAAAIVVDAVVRLLPGALGDSESAMLDSFQTGLLDAPLYTRPAEFEGMAVPDILQSGDHKKISEWRHEHAIERTKQRRPDILDQQDH